MNSTPQVPTQVISDADLDNVSGGILNGSLNNNALGLSADAPVSLSGALQAATGTVDAATGLNLQGVSGLVSGL
ncbi:MULTISPECIES: type A2 lantipeptide [unclassified Streptomyces]|uniref:type A2 lantipeptide n=1 Tax=unclassified Streptomyces TaxID=2593676 RepID=UPI00381F6AFB